MAGAALDECGSPFGSTGMNGLTQWGLRHGVTAAAMHELRTLLAAPSQPDASVVAATGSEARASNDVRIEASRLGGRLWRNNVGAGKLENGSFVRWGLCNDSSALNATCKSGDLIGIMPVFITYEHVGQVIGRFVSREIKRPGWKYAGTDREIAQLRWAESINAMGGDAMFATGVGTLK